MPSLLDKAARSDPRDVRLIWSYVENGECVLEVTKCFNIGPITNAVNDEPTEVLCTNPYTGRNEVVAVIDGASTQKVTFDIERLLPKEGLSLFMELVKKNCGLRMYIARADECIDPFDVNEYNSVMVLGEVFLGNYITSDYLFRNKANAGAITEGTTVTAYQFEQFGQHNVATRGGLHTAPIVDVALCDKKVCGGRCAEDSDGCQKWFTVQEDGIVGYTEDQFTNESVLAVIPPDGIDPGFLGTATTISCGARGQLIVTSTDGVNSAIHYTTIEDILDDGVATWTTIQVDTDANALLQLNDVYYDQDALVNWYAGNTGSLYQYDPSDGTVTLMTVIPGVVANFNKISKLGDDIILAGDAATLVRSIDGGSSFHLVTIIDPATGLDLDVGINLTAAAILSTTNFAVGTDDDRVLYTLDSGDTWHSQLIYGAGAGAITDISFYSTQYGSDIGYMTRNEGGMGYWYSTAYGNCSEWIQIPESVSETLPTNEGLVETLICPDNPNVAVAVGTSDGGAGVTFLATSTYH